jgi:predicted nuclease of restriction endonuclease-like RecB superfamily
VLPSEFLTVRRWRDQISPKYSNLNMKDVSAAEAAIRVYVESVGLKRKLIREKVTELEDLLGDYRLIRGLAALIERMCNFTTKSEVDPFEARHMLFTEAARAGFPASPDERRRILEAAAAKVRASPEQLESSMYADVDTEMALEHAPAISPAELLKQYNLSLTQTLLFNSTELTFMASGNWQRIFRAVKFYGLMYTVFKRDGGFMVRLDGPSSLFKLTKRYGTALAKVLPEILRGNPWRIEAKILRSNRLLNFTLESSRHSWLFPEMSIAEEYDSAVEADFASAFRSLATAWRLIREAEPVNADSSLMIPDFVFQLGGTRIAMEIIGFWTEEYLGRKLDKLARVRGMPFIVAVDENLACDRLTRIKALKPNIHVIYYKGRILVKDVLDFLQPYAEKEAEAQASTVKLEIKKPIATLMELAAESGVIVDAMRRAAAKISTHVLIGDTLVERGLLDNIRNVLEHEIGEGAQLAKALEALKPYNLPEPISLLSCCGYRVKWRGLSTEDARVEKMASLKNK